MTLDERIAAAFGEGPSSAEVAALIGEAEAAAASAEHEAEEARKRALDPRSADVSEARRQMDDAAFRRDRLRVAVMQLEKRVGQLQANEENTRRWAAYHEAEAERDRLAVELREVYPEVADRLVELLSRIVANDRVVERVNNGLPDGANRLRGAEEVARGLQGFKAGLENVPQMTTALRLPGFAFSAQWPWAWPPREPVTVLVREHHMPQAAAE